MSKWAFFFLRIFLLFVTSSKDIIGSCAIIQTWRHCPFTTTFHDWHSQQFLFDLKGVRLCLQICVRVLIDQLTIYLYHLDHLCLPVPPFCTSFKGGLEKTLFLNKFQATTSSSLKRQP